MLIAGKVDLRSFAQGQFPRASWIWEAVQVFVGSYLYVVPKQSNQDMELRKTLTSRIPNFEKAFFFLVVADSFAINSSIMSRGDVM